MDPCTNLGLPARPCSSLALRGAALLVTLASLASADASAREHRHRDAPIPRPKLELEDERPRAKDQPAEAEQFFLKKRLAPGMKELPVERLLQGREHARHMRLHATPVGRDLVTSQDLAQASSLTWTALGPGNIGGRTRALAFAPNDSNTIYVGGVAGGVWKTTNFGGSWTPLGDFMANMAVTALRIDPTDPLRIYAGTGEGYFNGDAVRGAGIFLSTDGGTNWAQIPSTSGFTRVNDLAISPNDHNTLYAATRTGLLSSNNGGTTWTQRIDANNALGCMKVVVRTDVNPDTVVASCGTFSPTNAATGIWRSVDGNLGAPTWTHIVGPTGSGATQTLARMGRTSLAIAPSSQGTMYALIACAQAVAADCGNGNFADGLLAVFKTADGGATWVSAYTSAFSTTSLADGMLTNPEVLICENTPGFNQGWYDNVIAVDPTNANRVFTGGIDQFRSDDSGATWGTISYWWIGDAFAQYAHADQHGIFFHPNYNGTTETRSLITNDGGIFVSSDAATATRAIAKTNVCPATSGNLRGASWTNLNNGYGVTQYYHGTAYPGGTRYFGGAQDNGTSRGSDAGGTNAWVEINGGDGGWTAIDKNTSGASTVLYAEFTGISIVKSSNDGGSFANAITGIASTGCGQFINPFQMDPNNTQRLWTSHSVLWRTANAAVSWTQASAQIPGTTCTPTMLNPDSGERFSNYAVAVGNPDLLVAGTDFGRLCRLTGATTSTSGTALQNCSTPAGGGYVSDVAFDPQTTGIVPTNAIVYATISTFGLGHVWRSIDSGVTWSNIDGSGVNGLPDVPADSVAVSPFDSMTIYVGTDIGVFVTTDGGVNWARENTGFANVITDHLVFSPVDSSNAQLFAFTHGRGAFRTTVSTSLTAANLSIAKTDGITSVNAGGALTYTITVTNPVAATIASVAVADAFPAGLTCTWTCAASAGGSCAASGSGSIMQGVTLGPSGTVTFTVPCTVSASATGNLVNAATVTYAGDPTPANNSATDTDSVVAQSNLGITKTDGVTTVNAGGTVPTYTITVTNPATVAVANVGVSDTFPGTLSGCTWSCSASAGGTCQSANGSNNISTTTNSVAGNNGTLTFNVSSCALSAAATGSLANTATVSYSNDPTPGNNTATDTDTILPQANLGITKSDGVTSINAGSPVSYTITVTNPATVAVANVGVSDTLPGTLSGCTWTCNASAGGTCQSANGSNNISTTTNTIAGSGGTLTFNATCTLSASATGTLANTATVSYANDPTPGNNSAMDSDTIVPQANLGITKTDGSTTANAGANVVYTIVVTNPSSTAVGNVGVSDTFPAGLSGCSWTCIASAGGACQNANGSNDIATTTNSVAGASGTLTFSATCALSASASGQLANTATVSYGNDPTPGNNSAMDTDNILPLADLGITKSDGVTSINAGSQTTYTIVATNPSTNAVSNVGVSDTFPGTLSGCTWTCIASAGGACQNANGSNNIATTTNSIAASGGTLTFSATCTLAAGATGSLQNTASVIYGNDPATGNNSAVDTDSIVPQANLGITKSDGVTTVNAGGTVPTYTITVTNPATVAVTNVGVSDTIPGTLSACTWTCAASPGGACESANGSNNISTTANSVAANGGTLTFNVASCALSGAATGSLANTATVSYGNDPTPGNNSALDTDTILAQADLGITKSDGVTSINAGSPVSYTITVTNPSAGAVGNVGVSDTFPGTLSGCTWTCGASAGGACQSANGSNNISTTTNSIAGGGGTLTFGASCTLSASATGSLANTATVSYANDPAAGNNSALDTDTIVPQANLGITKSDGVTTVNAGSNVVYTIVVTNPSTSAVGNVGVSDTFPAGLSGCTWTCIASAGGACQSANGSNNISTTTNTVAGSSGTLTFTATCTLSASATGSLANTATASYSNDPTPGNNSAQDTDTILPLADLGITKSDGVTSINAGSPVGYTITVTNPSTNAVGNVGVGDTFPAGLSGCTWTCNASAGGACQNANGSNGISTTTNSIAGGGGTLTFNAGCTLSASATGSLANTATVSYANDPAAGNNSAMDTDTIVPQANLGITKTDGVTSVNAGAQVTYTIVASNPTGNAVANATVADTFPGTLGACAWTCTPSAGSTCTANGAGNINNPGVTIAAGGNVSYSATCTLSASATGSLANTATVAYANDPTPGNDSATDTDTIVPQANLGITKSDGSANATAGNSVTYTIVASNPSGNAVTGVTVADTFPGTLSGCTWACTPSAGSTCTANGAGNISNSGVSIAAGGNVSYSATCTLSAAASGSLVNTATVSSANDPNGTNDSATDTDTILPPSADLGITKSDGVGTVNAGASVGYTIVVTNPSANTVGSVAVSDTFPGILSGCTWTCSASAGGACQSANGSNNIGTTTNSVAGAGGTLTFSATCTLSAAASGSLANTATVSYSNDPTPGNNSAVDTDTIVPQANLAISKDDGIASINAGSPTTYTIVASNPSANAVSNVTIADTFPGALSGCNWTCTPSAGSTCTANGSGNISNSGVTIAAGGNVSYSATCTLSASASGPLANTATVSYANDPTPGNNSATDTDTVVVQANLGITKTDGATSVNAGAPVTYTIVASNPSANAASGVTVADAFPATLTGCAWTCTPSAGSTCTAIGAGDIANAGVTIAAGGNVSYSATCTLSASASGSLANTATVTHGNDPVPGNNSATDTDTIVPQANLGITKSDGSVTAVAGGNVSYTIVVTNPSANTVGNVAVSDTFVGTLSGCSWTCSASAGGACQNANGSNNIGTTTNSVAGAGGTLTFSATCALSPAAAGSLLNTATVAYANDPVATNNSATDTDAINPPAANVGISKTDGQTLVVAGDSVAYTITVSNPSANAIANVAVADTFPASLSACSWTCAASSGGGCTASGNGSINELVSLGANGGTAIFSATCILPASATGQLQNTATAAYANDPDLANNSATDTDTILPRADVSISKDDGGAIAVLGQPVVYTIVVTNPAAVAISAVGVSDTFPAVLTGCGWTCSAGPGGSCAASGSGDIDESVGIGAGQSVTFVATCTLSQSATGTLLNSASASYANDPNAANDSDSDSDAIVSQHLFEDGFEDPAP